ncbi:MAG: twin-arginine translocation signal domain-containing protein [Luteitalea sp.]|nr:twin-arginine translocation signal domain-containing protein [Luteitalea sp.]
MRSITRRRFVKAAGAAGVGLAVVDRRAAWTLMAPSDRVRVAVMGVNSRGHQLARVFAQQPGAEVAVICDVDGRAMSKTIDHVRDLTSVAPKGEADVRRVIEDPSIDAVVVAAPDHWHAPAAIMAVAAGKHVYLEKPASHNPNEGELLVAAANRSKRLVQLGTQRRSWSNVVRAMEQLETGVIGRPYYAATWYANNRPSIGRGRETAVPDWLDYELWQGPAPRRSYKDNFIHYEWHWFWHWGTGEVGNNGTHLLDMARWGLGVGLPTRVTAAGGRYRYDDDWECPDTEMTTWEFADNKMITWEGRSCAPHRLDASGAGITFHGEQGTLVIDRNGYRVYDLKDELVTEVDDTAASSDQGTVGPGATLDAVHIANFLDAIRGEATLNAPIDEGHKSTMLAHLGNIASRTGHVLHCDPETGHVKDDPEAAKLWGREYEKGWEPTVTE